MGILTTDFVGQQGVNPRRISYITTHTYAQITAAGYFDMKSGILPTDFIFINYGANNETFGIFTPAIAAGVMTLSPLSNAGEVTLIGSAVANNIPKFADTTGNISDSGIAYTSLLTTSSVVSDYQEFIPLTNILINSVGTWTRTRVAQGNYSLVHTPADDTSVIGIDITPNLRAATSKGFILASIDVIYTIATLALDAHTLSFQSVAYANNAAVAVTSVALTGSLATATQTNPYVTNLAVTTPGYLNTACAKYNLELTVNAAATSVYSFYGLNLHFSQTVG